MTDGLRFAAQILVWSRLGDFLAVAAVPVIATLFLRGILRLLELGSASSRVAGVLAFTASSMPGLVFLGLAPFTIHHLDARKYDWPCMIHCYALTVIFATFICRAMWMLFVHARNVTRLMSMTHDPSPLLADLAAELNMSICQLPTTQPICCVAGALRPRVVVSTGAASRCSRSELRAALLHERAHGKARATLWATIATFLNECSPCPLRRAVALLQHRSELFADQEVAQHVDPSVLVSALLKLTDSGLRGTTVANFADQARLKDRVKSLLIEDSGGTWNFVDFCAGLLLVGVASLTWAPVGLHAAIRILTCKGCM